jgi:UDP-N-acetylglucosamine acyltransferase
MTDEYRLVQGAWVHKRATLPEDPGDISLEPGAFIGADVELGPGCWIGTGAVVYGPTRIGANNRIFPKAVLGGAPQDLGYAGEPTRLEIGERNVFREGVTISRASTKGDLVTKIGNDNFLMAFSHVGHDCVLEDHVVLANGVLVAGHCHLESYASLSGGCAVVQFTTLGRFAFVCGTSGIRKDVEPYIAHDIRSKTQGGISPACINVVGLKRGAVSSEVIEKLRSAYKVLYLRKTPLGAGQETRGEIERRDALCPEVEELLAFIERKRNSRHGRARGV